VLNYKNVPFLIFVGILCRFIVTMSFLSVLSSVLGLCHYVQVIVFLEVLTMIIFIIAVINTELFKDMDPLRFFLYICLRGSGIRGEFLVLIKATINNRYGLSFSILHLFWKQYQS